MPASDFNIGGVEGQIAALNTQIAYRAGDVLTFATDGSDAFFGFVLQSNQIYAYIPLAKPVVATSISVSYPESGAMRTKDGLVTFSIGGIVAKTIGKSTIQIAIGTSGISSSLFNTPVVVGGAGFAITFS